MGKCGNTGQRSHMARNTAATRIAHPTAMVRVLGLTTSTPRSRSSEYAPNGASPVAKNLSGFRSAGGSAAPATRVRPENCDIVTRFERPSADRNGGTTRRARGATSASRRGAIAYVSVTRFCGYSDSGDSAARAEIVALRNYLRVVAEAKLLRKFPECASFAMIL